MRLRRHELHAPPYDPPEPRAGQLGLPDEHQPLFPTRLQRLDGFLVRLNTLNKHIGLLAEAGWHVCDVAISMAVVAASTRTAAPLTVPLRRRLCLARVMLTT